MGTNYYWYPILSCTVCCCKHNLDKENKIHIGKSSMGWKFCFEAHTDLNLNSAEDYLKYFDEHEGVIHDEYGNHHNVDDFWVFISKKQDDPKNRDHIDGSVYKDKDGYNFDRRPFS